MKAKKILELKTSQKRFRPSKALGQNFLHSKSVARKLVSVAQIKKTDIVLEVGPGKGIITKILLQEAKKVIAVEKDERLVSFLKEKFSEEIKNKKFVVVYGDILHFNPKNYNLKPKTYILIGSIPYYITGNFLRYILTHEIFPKTVGLIIQKEVAARIAREKKESLLSLSVKVFGIPKYVKTVKRGNFNPSPNVDSAILIIENISKNFFKAVSEKKFFDAIHAGFAHKRKLLKRNMETIYKKEEIVNAFRKCNINEKTRAEELALNKWKCLISTL